MEHFVAVLMINFAVVVAAQNQVSLALSDYENLGQIVHDVFMDSFAPNIPLVLEAHRLIVDDFIREIISNIYPTTQFMAELLLADSDYYNSELKFMQEYGHYFGYTILFEDTFKKLGINKDQLESRRFDRHFIEMFDECYAIHAKPSVDVFASKLKAKLNLYSPRLIAMYNTSLPKVILNIASIIGELQQKITAYRTPEIAAKQIIKGWLRIRETLWSRLFGPIWTLIYDGMEKLGARVQTINEEFNLEMGDIKSFLKSCLNNDPPGLDLPTSISQDQVPLAFTHFESLEEIARNALIKDINATFPPTREVFRSLREEFIMGKIFNIHPSAQMAAALLDESVWFRFIYIEASLSPIIHGYYLDFRSLFDDSLTQLGIEYNRDEEVTFDGEVIDTGMLNGCYLIHAKPTVDALASTLEAKLDQYSPKWIAMFNSSFTKVNERILNEIATLQQKIDEYKTPETALRGIAKRWPSLRDKFEGFSNLVANVFNAGQRKLEAVVQQIKEVHNLKFGDIRSAMKSCMTIDVVASMSTADHDELESTSLTP